MMNADDTMESAIESDLYAMLKEARKEGNQAYYNAVAAAYSETGDGDGRLSGRTAAAMVLSAETMLDALDVARVLGWIGQVKGLR